MTWGGSGPFLFDGAAAEIGFLPIEGITSPPGGFISAWCYNCNTVLGDGMKKNVAGQKIGAQLISATDGSAFTGSVSVYVTGDGGTQNAGGGTVTHEGNGYHGYAPTQAETNYDHIAFTFTGTGAVPATAQVFTDFPQTGDAYDRLGAPAGASVSADVAAVKTQTAAIETDTQDIQSRLPASLVSGRMDSSVGAMAANTLTASALAADAVTEIQTGLATASDLATVASYIDTEVAAIKAKTDNLPASPAATGDIPSAATIAGAVWDEAYAGHLTAGTFGNVVANLPDAATTAYEVWQADPAGWSAAAGTFGKLLIDAETDAGLIKTVTDKLNDTLELDTSIYRFTANALEQAPSSGGSLTAADVWAYETRTLTAGTNIVLAKGTGVTGFNDLSAAQVNAEVDTAISDVGLTTTITGRIDAAISSRLASASYTEPDNASVTAIKAKTDNLPPDPADASDIAAAFGTVNTNIYALNDLSEADIRNALGLASANLDTQLQTVDDNVDAVKAKTDQLTFTVAGQVDANAESMNGAQILGNGTSGNLWRGS